MKHTSILEVLRQNQNQKKDKTKKKRKLRKRLGKEKILRKWNGNEWKKKHENE